ncbi:hypothetical protein ScPMuIL_002589 [Solemya velum]
MTESLFWQDHLTIGLYFLVVLIVGIWSTFRTNRGNTTGYFLAGKAMLWLPIGASIYASNIGAPMFIGLAGTAAASGFAVTIYEWLAVFCLIALGWVFVPVYIASGSYTMPGYLKRRFGGRRIQMYASILSLIEYILHNISAEIYSGAIFMQQLLGWNMYLCVVTILAVTAIYTVVGGLTSVIYTDTLQAVILICGSLVLAVLSLEEVGGWENMKVKYMNSSANYTLSNLTIYQCGLPREDSFHLVRHPVAGDIPWTGVASGLVVLGMFTWCQDQIIVQRCLSAKNISHSKAGCLLACVLKLLSFLTFVIPGMISRILYPNEIACADPEMCRNVCQNEAGCSNLAYPLLVLRLLPVGLRGLMLAALLSALMSSLTSIFNSASSIVTLDIWRLVRKRAKQKELMIVGRVSVLVLVAVSILWLPILQQSQGGILWFYVQAIKAYLVPPWATVFFLALFWKRTTEKGVFWGLIFGLIVGAIRMGLDFSFSAPLCGDGGADPRPSIVSKVDFLHFAFILFVLSMVVIVIISLFTQPMAECELRGLTWWSRNNCEEPKTPDDDDVGVEITSLTVMGGSGDNMPVAATIYSTPDVEQNKRAIWKLCYAWICGISDDQTTFSKKERALDQSRLTSITEDERWRAILNLLAVVIAMITVYLIDKRAIWKICYAWICGISDDQTTFSKKERALDQSRLTSITEDERWRAILNLLAVVIAMITVYLIGLFS